MQMRDEHSKILVIRFSSLGDLILMTPLLKSLKARFQGCEIHVATKDKYTDLFLEDTNVDKVKPLQPGGLRELLRLRAELSREGYDIIIDAHNVIRSNLILNTLRSGMKVQIGKDQIKKLLLIKAKINLYRRPIHISQRYLQTVEPLEVEPVGTVPEIVVPDTAFNKIKELLLVSGLTGKKLVAFAPGSRWATKMWPPEYFERLISSVGQQGLGTIVIGGPEDVDLNREIGQKCSPAPLDLTGTLTILESAAVLHECRVLITNDSAPLHLAEAVGTPVIALLGPTVREFGYYPQMPQSSTLELQLPCRPCSRNGARPCPLGTKECLTSIFPERVLDALWPVVKDFKTEAPTVQT